MALFDIDKIPDSPSIVMLVPKDSKHSPDVIIQCIVYYSVSGDMNYVSRCTGVPSSTIQKWRSTPWWKECLREVQKEQQQRLDAKLTKLIDLSVEKLNERIVKGDAVVSLKDGVVKGYKPVSALDLTKITCMLYEKRALLRGDPTQRIEKTPTSTILDSLAKKFQEIANGKVIEGETVRDDILIEETA